MAAPGVFEIEIHDTNSPEDEGSSDEFHAAEEFQVWTEISLTFHLWCRFVLPPFWTEWLFLAHIVNTFLTLGCRIDLQSPSHAVKAVTYYDFGIPNSKHPTPSLHFCPCEYVGSYL